MKEFKEIIKKKGIRKTIVYSVLTLIMLSPLIILNKPVVGALKGTCTAKTFSQLQTCQKEGRYTKIKTENIYDVGYNYVVDGETKGKFLDVDLGGNVILTLADVTLADELLNKTGTREISGNFTSFDSKVFKETLQKIENDYIERFTNEAGIITEEETRGMFFPYLLNQYDGRGFPYIVPVLIVGIIVILLIFKVIEGIKMITKPGKFIVHGRKTLERDENAEKASFEFHNGPYLFKNKEIRITNNYIFNLTGYNFTYHKVNEAVWMYEKGIKRYGLFETGKYLIIKFKDHVGFALKLNLAERKKVMEILRVKNPGIQKGYSEEVEKSYRKKRKAKK